MFAIYKSLYNSWALQFSRQDKSDMAMSYACLPVLSDIHSAILFWTALVTMV